MRFVLFNSKLKNGELDLGLPIKKTFYISSWLYLTMKFLGLKKRIMKAMFHQHVKPNKVYAVLKVECAYEEVL